MGARGLQRVAFDAGRVPSPGGMNCLKLPGRFQGLSGGKGRHTPEISVAHPFPPNPRMDVAGNLEAISPSDYFWLNVRTPDGRRTDVG